MGYIYLAIAVLAEVAGTSFLKTTEGFTRPVPTAFVLVAYGLAFWMLSMSLKTMTVAVVYALWCGAGIVLIAISSNNSINCTDNSFSVPSDFLPFLAITSSV
jgi:small multidrug resistance pump